VDLVQYQSAASVTEHWDNWEKVVEKLRTGQMPPPGFPQPDKDAVEAVTGWMHRSKDFSIV
jgi:hypothetical protein